MTDAKCDTFIMILVTPTPNKLSIDRSNIVLPRITNIGFGILSVKGNIRRPWPAANIIAVLGISTSEEGSCSMNIRSCRSSLSHFQ